MLRPSQLAGPLLVGPLLDRAAGQAQETPLHLPFLDRRAHPPLARREGGPARLYLDEHHPRHLSRVEPVEDHKVDR